jgi:dUTP pyrophosphatase
MDLVMLKLMDISVKALCVDAIIPSFGTVNSVGADLYALHGGDIAPGATVMIPTGLSMTPPDGYFIKIESKSGLATKGLFVIGGIIDPDYRGDITVILHNSSGSVFSYADAQKIGQMVLYPYCKTPAFAITEDLGETARGDGGFGSTGKF